MHPQSKLRSSLNLLSFYQQWRDDYRDASWYWWTIAAFVLFRLFIMAQVGFIDDEAYHWTWAKHLAWSYYDHPGMVAWMIWPFSQIFGDHAFAIRLPGFLMTLGIVFVVYRLGRDLFGVAVARLASLLIFAIPLWGFASLGTLPDIPLAFFWILMVWIFWQTVKTLEPWSSKKTWLWIGVVMGLGMNSKLTCCLIGLGMLVFLLLSPRLRAQLCSPWPYLGALITFVMMTPVFVWNANHDWASFKYQFMSRHTEALGMDWGRWLQFWSYQWIFMSPGIYFFMLVALITALFRWRDDRWRFLFCLSIPSLALFYYQPLMSAYKPHWSGPAYMVLLFGACAIFLQGLPWLRPRSRVAAIICSSFLVLFGLLYIPLLSPVIPRLYSTFAADPTKWNPTWDFSNEFFGWRELGSHLHKMQEDLWVRDGQKPMLGAQRYELISQLAWGTQDQVWQLTDEKDQFHFNQPLEEKQKLFGQSFLVVNNDKYPRDPMETTRFASCEKSEFPFYRGEILARTFYIYYCRDLQHIGR